MGPARREGVRRLVESYDPGFRATMAASPEEVEDPAALARHAASLSAPARALLDLALLVVPPGDPLPDRLRTRIERDGALLWRHGLLLPRSSGVTGGSILPTHYIGSCRLNPHLQGLRPHLDPALFAVAPGPPQLPPADARWDGLVVAAALEADPAPLRDDGQVRRDVERRLYGSLGGDQPRWALALKVARAQGLVRAEASRLRGFPEVVPRPLPEPAVLFDLPAAAFTATLWSRILREDWVAVEPLLDWLGEHFADGLTDGGSRVGWPHATGPLLRDTLDVLHRVGLVDAVRDHERIVAARLPTPRPRVESGVLLTPDGQLLALPWSLAPTEYGRLARIAPYQDGDRMYRHRLSREGIATDMSAGHGDTLAFLEVVSRTGVPASVQDQLAEWRRAAGRVTILTGVDVLEEGGALRIVPRPPTAPHRAIDYLPAPRARFLYQRGRLIVPTGWDALTVRATLARIGRPAEQEPDGWVYLPERRRHANVPALLDRLRSFHGGELPGEVEALVLAGGGLPPVRVEEAVLVHIPTAAATALRRDAIVGPLLHRWVGSGEVVILRSEVAVLRARLEALGLSWEG